MTAALLSASGLVAVAGTSAPASAQAVASRPLNVLLLGDSYSAGNGARDGEGNRDYAGVEDCYRSPSNWASQYAAKLRASGQEVRFNNKACSGAVTDNMLNPRLMDDFTGVSTVTGRFTSTTDPAAIKAFDDASRCTSRRVADRVEETWSVKLDSVVPSSFLNTTTINGRCQRHIKAQLDWVTPDVDLVLFTIGGNDIGFENIVQQCFVPFNRNVEQCEEQIDASNAGLPGALTNARTILDRMKGTLRADAKVALLSYPLLELRDEYTLSRPFASYQAGKAVRDLGKRAVRDQEALVTAANTAYGRDLVTFVPQVPTRFATREPDGRYMDTNANRWIYETPKGDYSTITLEFYHPKPEGHGDIASLLFDTYGTFGLTGRPAARNDIDVAFVIDTTGSMGGVINDVRTYAAEIARQLAAGSNTYRFALVDYRDHPSHTGWSGDYPSRLDVPFTTSLPELQAGLDSLRADGGGDWPESAWSGMTEALRLPWRPGVQKVLITMADAPAHNPEPVTGLTAADVIKLALEIDPVQVYTVDVGNATNMRPVSEQTGGAYFTRASGDVPTLISRSLSTALGKPSAWLNGPVDARTGQAVTLSAEGSYATDGGPLTYEWDFTGDGTYDTTTTGPTVGTTYAADTDALLTLRVTDRSGGTALATIPVRTTRDGDSVPTDADNCPDVWNDDQGDLDKDGAGDACDPTPGYEVSNGTTDDGDVTDPDGNSTPGTITAFPAPNWHRSDTLPTGDPGDYFGLTKPDKRPVQLVLGGLTADFDLEVLRADGTAVSESVLTGLRSETLRLDGAPGRYLVRVHAKPGHASETPYRLVATLLAR